MLCFLSGNQLLSIVHNFSGLTLALWKGYARSLTLGCFIPSKISFGMCCHCCHCPVGTLISIKPFSCWSEMKLKNLEVVLLLHYSIHFAMYQQHWHQNRPRGGCYYHHAWQLQHCFEGWKAPPNIPPDTGPKFLGLPHCYVYWWIQWALTNK